ncbi:MAG: hypothetical protein JWM19_4381 [Actinomycetia bacterium]|nr:hypothetical protein [Actinomycetes bacterium]
MSSHREAPEISKDPVADSTDLYAFVSPDQPDTLTLIANYIPLQGPAGGPNFYSFGDDVLYEIHIDTTGDARPDLTYQFRFRTELRNPDTFLYNTGPVTALDSPNWNNRQFCTLTRVTPRKSEVLGSGLACPPCNIGPLSTPNYPALASAAVHEVTGGIKVFAGQRADGFYVDLGAVFDLADLRPFENLHAQYGLNAFSGPAAGVNATAHLNVHSIAIQVPLSDVLPRAAHSAESDRGSVLGIWTTASRQRARVWDSVREDYVSGGPWHQVSRLGNPLFNEVLVGLGSKDRWNAVGPSDDKRFASGVAHPELAALLPALYPGVFPNLAALVSAGTARADLEAILLTGIPSGIIPGFQNYTGSLQADLLRINTAIPPSKSPNILGVVGGDLAGYPNGRRVFDDVVTIELRAIAGVTVPLVDKSFTPDAAASVVTDGLTASSVPSGYLDSFPYLGVPYSGFTTPSS